VDLIGMNENDKVNNAEAVSNRDRNTRMMRSSIQVFRETKQLKETEKLAKFDGKIVDCEKCTEGNSNKIENTKRKINQMANVIQKVRQKLSILNCNLPLNYFFNT
jgi:hypothetical protein